LESTNTTLRHCTTTFWSVMIAGFAFGSAESMRTVPGRVGDGKTN
jgi:hypothetical protein